MTHYLPYPDDQSEFPSEDEPYVPAPRRVRSTLFTVAMAAVACALVASSLLLS